MASARPSAFKEGGAGLWNGDFTIRDYEFTNEFAGEVRDSKNPNFTPTYMKLVLDKDGADEPVEAHLYNGINWDDITVEDDGHTIEHPDPDFQVPLNTGSGRFLASLVNAPGAGGSDGFSEEELPDDRINYEPIIGLRLRLKGVAVLDKEGKVKTRTAKKGNFKGRTFPVEEPQVAVVYGKANEKSTSKGSTKSASRTNGSGKSVKSNEPDIDSIGVEALIGILQKQKNNTVQKRSLTVAISNALGAKHPQREEVRRRVLSDDFLETQQGWTYDKTSKTQDIVLA